MDQILSSAAESIQTSDVLIITAGAGLSVDGGIPDFVDVKKALPEISHLGLNVFEISNDNIFLKDPRFAWGVYGKRMDDYREASPHEGYYILLRWCLAKKDWWVYTSNIDQHFLRAGFPKERIVECHRSLYEFQCSMPCCDDVWDGRDVKVDYDEVTLVVKGDIPRCRHCGDAARPCTVLAVDSRWLRAYTKEQEGLMDKQLADIPPRKSIAILELGCGVQMPKVRDKSEELVSRFRDAGHRTTFIRVNPTLEHLRMPTPKHPDNIPVCQTALYTLAKMNEILRSI